MTPEAEKLLRRIGWRPDHEAWWEAFNRLWFTVSTTEQLRHNLLVCVISTDMGMKRAAAFEVASTVTALMFVLAGGRE